MPWHLIVGDGPDKPALLWALTYPERERVHFRSDDDGVDVEVTRMDEHADGFSFSLRGVVRSGHHNGSRFVGVYSVESRSGTLSVA